MSFRFFAILTAVGVLLSGCASRPKHFKAPDPAAMNSARIEAQKAVDKASQSAAKSRVSVDSAKQTAAKGVQITATIEPKLAALREAVPAPFKPAVVAAIADVDALKSSQAVLAIQLAAAASENATLKIDLETATAQQSVLEKTQASYEAEAGKLAVQATEERDARIAVEKKLSWYFWHWWGSWIVFGAGLAAWGVFLFLKFTGRAAITLSKPI